MKSIMSNAVRCIAVIVFIACFAAVPSIAQSTEQHPCSGGTWTPEPVQQAESGTAEAPAFHTIYGWSCGGTVYMIRFSNKVNGKDIAADKLGSVLIGCSGGTWTPKPVQHAESGTAVSPAFHTVWGLACGGTVYMIRFSNKVNGNNIVVDILKQMHAD